MTNILSQSEVAAIREKYDSLVVGELCDTIDALRAKLEVAKETEHILRIAFADAIQYRAIAVKHGAPSVNQRQFERLVENHLEALAQLKEPK